MGNKPISSTVVLCFFYVSNPVTDQSEAVLVINLLFDPPIDIRTMGLLLTQVFPTSEHVQVDLLLIDVVATVLEWFRSDKSNRIL